MITKSDWKAVHEQMLADERRKLGDPPTFDEVLAYTRGELPAEEEERVRALLVAYPELALAVTEPFPDEDPADRELVSDEELASRWKALQERVGSAPAQEEGGRVLTFSGGWLAAAAATLVFGGLFVNEHRNVRELRARADAPRIVNVQTLRSSAVRGGGSTRLTLQEQRGGFVFAIPKAGLPPKAMEHRNFTIKLRDQSGKWLWESEILAAPETTFHIGIGSEYLPAGQYEIVLYGRDGQRQEWLSSYVVNVEP